MAKENLRRMLPIKDAKNGKLRSPEIPLIKRDEMYYIPSLVFLVGAALQQGSRQFRLTNDKVEK